MYMSYQRILVCGSRDWSDAEIVKRRLDEFDRDSTVIHGGCRGADKIAGEVAEMMGMRVEVYTADWEAHGKAAGPRRNQKMLDEGKPTVVIAFHDDIARSKGTSDMISRAKKSGLTTEIIDSKFFPENKG